MDGYPHFKVQATGRTYKVWDWLYKVRDYYTSYLDTQSLLSSLFVRQVSEGDYEANDAYRFERENKLAVSKDTSTAIEHNTHDLLSILYHLRCVDYTEAPVGTKAQFTFLLGSKVYKAGLELMGRKTIKTKLGTFECMVIKPDLVKGRIFKGQEDMTVYVSNDLNQVPIRIESAIFVGRIKADLVEFKNLRYPLSSRKD